jgi:ATP-dependent Lhr-like helicase
MLELARAGKSALLVAATGSGKTLAGFLPSICELIEAPAEGLHTLYVSPLKALGVDVQRNLLGPISEMELDIRVETRSGDTPSDRKVRQRLKPPQMLLTTPESLSLLLSYPEAPMMFAGLKTIVVDELHAFAKEKRGDLLALSMARLQQIAPALRRVGLSATISDPEAYRGWLAPNADATQVDLVAGDPGAEPDLSILIPENRIPWSGHSGRHAAREVMELIERHRTTLIFCNTRSLAELIFQDLWAVNDKALPIGIHHGSLALEARRKVEAAMAAGKLRGLVATASLDLGIDWGDIDLVVQMGAPKGSSRLLQRIGRANHRLDEPSRAALVPGNRFELLECLAARDALAEHDLDGGGVFPGGLDVLAQHVMGVACAGPFDGDALYEEVRQAAPFAALARRDFDDVLDFVATGGYALRTYERYRRLERGTVGLWRLVDGRLARQYRMNVGTIVEAPVVRVRLGRRRLGEVEEMFVASLAPGDTFLFAGQVLAFEGMRDNEAIVTLAKGRSEPKVPTYAGSRFPLTTELAARVRAILADAGRWDRLPDPVREWLRAQVRHARVPEPDELLVETFERRGRHHLVAYSFAGHRAHQTLGMLLTRRMERRRLRPQGFVASDYCIAVWGLEPVEDVPALFDVDILGDDLEEWMAESSLIKRTFRNCAVVAGLIERRHPGAEKTGRQVTFSADLVYDVLRKHDPDHVLLRAARAEAATGLTDVRRLADLLVAVQGKIRHVRLPRISPFAVSIIAGIGRESVAGDLLDRSLDEAVAELVAEAMGD